MNTVKHHQSGFTLIELSIVLVIIGLIVGGVLVGQDMIKAAQVRATVGQVEKYNAAANTFLTKYNGLPGDIAGAANFGLAATGAGTGVGLGNGNKLIEASCNGTVGNQAGGETLLFWTHLSQANLIAEKVTNAIDLTYACPAATAIDASVLPLAKLGGSNYFGVTSAAGFNYFLIGVSGTTVVTTGAYSAAKKLTPLDAFSIDSKFDDGLAASGIVRAVVPGADPATVDAGVATAAPPAAGDCYVNDSAPVGAYNITATAGNAGACELRIRGSF
jgi:prepilin-type N-terminal cleavage/methylation domain-containing protein